MKLQPAIEFLSVYTWTILGIIIFVAIIIALSIGLGNTTYPPSTCYISPTLQCSKMYITWQKQSSPIAFLFFTNDLGKTISFPINSFSVRPTYLNQTFYGTCSPQIAPNGNFVECTATLTGYSVSLGKELNPTFTVSYGICGSTCTGSLFVYSTSGSGTLTVSPYQALVVSNPPVIAYVTNAANVVIINTATNKVIGAVKSQFNGPAGVAFSPSGTFAYVAEYIGNGNVLIVNTATNTVVGSMNGGGLSNGPYGVAFSPSGTFAYATVPYPSEVAIINTATNTVVGSITSGINYPTGVGFSPTGNIAYVGLYPSTPGSIAIVNTATNTVVGSITSGIDDPYGVAFSPSGTFAYVANWGSDNVVVINTATSTVVNSIKINIAPYGVAFSPSGTFAYVTDSASNVLIINTATNTVVGSITSGINSPVGVAIN